MSFAPFARPAGALPPHNAIADPSICLVEKNLCTVDRSLQETCGIFPVVAGDLPEVKRVPCALVHELNQFPCKQMILNCWLGAACSSTYAGVKVLVRADIYKSRLFCQIPVEPANKGNIQVTVEISDWSPALPLALSRSRCRQEYYFKYVSGHG